MKNKKPFGIFAIFTFLLAFSSFTFAQADVPRQITAATYPLNDEARLQFRGTTRFPRMSGSAKIKRTPRNGTEIELSVDKMPRPFELGAGYATYVLWAISPEGQVDNLGEIKRRGLLWFDSKISVTTKLQTFALLVTAEPHFLVRQPSREIMLENLIPTTRDGRPFQTTKAVQYFGNSSNYFSDARTPLIAEADYAKTPQSILEAKQALALARYAGAERDAPEELKAAENLLINAENVWQAGRAESEIDIEARLAVSAAVKAEDTAIIRREAREKRNEKARQDAELQKVEDRYADAQQQIENLRFELARETRNRELSERESQTYDKQLKALSDENVRLRVELDKAKDEAASLKNRLERIEAEKREADRLREEETRRQERISQLQVNTPILIQSLKTFGTVRQGENGIILTLPETYWTGIRVSSFAKASDSKVTSLANLLANNPDYRIIIESHTDDSGNANTLQVLTQERAQAIADRLMSVGIEQNKIEVKGFGAEMPAAPNTTNANRAKNRRIDVLLIPNIN